MDPQPNSAPESCPVTADSVAAEARQRFEEMVDFCQHHEGTVFESEKRLLVLLFRLGCVLVRLTFVSRPLRLNLEPYLALNGYRLGNPSAERRRGGPPPPRGSSFWCWVWGGKPRRSCNSWVRRRTTARGW